VPKEIFVSDGSKLRTGSNILDILGEGSASTVGPIRFYPV